jgi:hypothetical protein
MTMDYRTLERAARREGAAYVNEYAGSVLRAVASGRSPLNAVRHPLGFYCFPLLREAGHGVCVHVFDRDAPDAAQPTTSRLHSHSWQLTSYVLYGELGNLRLQVSEHPEQPTHRVFEVHSSPSGTDEIRPTQRLVRCVAGATQSIGPGRVYTLPAGEFHDTVLTGGVASATLVLGSSVPGLTDLSLGPLHGAGHRVERRLCHADWTARLALAALRRIDDPRETD